MSPINPIVNWLNHSFPYFGLAGCLVVGITTLISAFSYGGKNEEKYSPFNHYISELGEVGVSQRAWAFNVGLILGGIALIPFVIGLGLYIQNAWSKLGMVAGIWTAIACACVGVFPMNNLPPHVKAAVAYFRGGLVTVLLFNLGILFQPAGGLQIPKTALVLGAVAVASYGSFLLMAGRADWGGQAPDEPEPVEEQPRPRFMLLPTIEWAVFFATILWFFAIAVVVRG